MTTLTTILKLVGGNFLKLFADAPLSLWLFSILGALIAWAFPDPVHRLTARAVFIAIGIDTLMGFWIAWKTKIVSSEGFAQIFTKLLVYLGLIVLLAAALDVMPLEHAYEGTLMSGLLTFMFGREALSFLENAKKLGFVGPSWLSKLFERLVDIDPIKTEKP